MKQQKVLILFCYSALIISALILPSSASPKVSHYHLIFLSCLIFDFELLKIKSNDILLELPALWDKIRPYK